MSLGKGLIDANDGVYSLGADFLFVYRRLMMNLAQGNAGCRGSFFFLF